MHSHLPGASTVASAAGQSWRQVRATPNDASVSWLVTAAVVETHDEQTVAERRYVPGSPTEKLRPTEEVPWLSRLRQTVAA